MRKIRSDVSKIFGLSKQKNEFPIKCYVKGWSCRSLRYGAIRKSVQFSGLVVSYCNPMDYSTPDFPAHHQLLEFTKTHAHQVGDAIRPSHPLASPSPLAFNLSQHQGLFKWDNSSHQMAQVLEFQLQHKSFQWTFRTDFLKEGLLGSPCSPRDSQESCPTPQFKSSILWCSWVLTFVREFSGNQVRFGFKFKVWETLPWHKFCIIQVIKVRNVDEIARWVSIDREDDEWLSSGAHQLWEEIYIC